MTTTEPMICAIVWGQDADLGRLNNSLAMNGTGLVDHDVSLPELDPGREYSFVVQGTTADGTLYRSPLGTFRIEASSNASTPGGVVEPPGPELAGEAALSDVSSEFSDAFGAAQAIDGDLATEWSTAGDGDAGFIELDLGRPRPVAGTEFVTRSMADGTATTTTFTVTVDGGETLGPFPASTVAAAQMAALDVTGQVFRFDVASSTGGNVGATEIRLYGRGS